MSDLIDWAQQLAEHSPEYAEFAQTVENYAERADINGLSQWLAQWR
jgi:N-acetylglucosamine kinase-like BadF-type ATPase